MLADTILCVPMCFVRADACSLSSIVLLLFVGLSVVADVLSDYMDGWKMLGCYYMQLGFLKISEADCWTLCLLHWYGRVPTLFALAFCYEVCLL
jgi:hypothetical protein